MQRLLQENANKQEVFLNMLLSHMWWRALMINRDETSLASLRDSLTIHGSLPNWLLFHSADSLNFLQDKPAVLYPLRILRDFPASTPLCSFPPPLSLSKSPEQSLYHPTCRATQTRRSASSTTMRSRWERNRAAVTAHHCLQHHDTHPPHHLLPPILYIP
jgi:hypothetical protein